MNPFFSWPTLMWRFSWNLILILHLQPAKILPPNLHFIPLYLLSLIATNILTPPRKPATHPTFYATLIFNAFNTKYLIILRPPTIPKSLPPQKPSHPTYISCHCICYIFSIIWINILKTPRKPATHPTFHTSPIFNTFNTQHLITLRHPPHNPQKTS